MLINSTLRLEASKQGVNYQNPWSVGGNISSSATVSVLKYEGENYLVTNAHAVLDSTYLKVKLNHNSTELPVVIAWNDPIRDLAIVKTTTVEAEEIIKKMVPLKLLSDFQPQGTEVFAYGYPSGGKSISFTKGNISRVEVSTMALSKELAITVQTSAPINPGNSGGPITIQSSEKNEELCIGIVAQSNPDLQNTGYFIPACTVINAIEQFKKYRHFHAKGFINTITAPQLGITIQELKNKPLRAALGLPQGTIDDELTGIRITSVSLNSCAYGLLKPGDIIQKIDNITVQSNGQVQVKELENPISFSYLILQKKYLDKLLFDIQRKNLDTELLENVRIEVQLTKQLGQNLLGPRYPKPLKYHIQPSGKGAFVFVRCTSGLISAYKNQKNPSTPRFFSELSHIEHSEAYEAVVLQQIIMSEETDGLENFPISKGANCVSHCVTEVNGQIIKNLFDLVTALSHVDKPVEVKFKNNKVLYVMPSHKEDILSLKEKQSISFFTSPGSAKINPALLISEINSLGKRDDNRVDLLKPAAR